MVKRKPSSPSSRVVKSRALKRKQINPSGARVSKHLVENQDFTVRKATTRRGRKILEKRLPQVHEESKRSVFLKGNKASNTLQTLMKDLHTLRKPESINLSRCHPELHPFDDAKDVEFLCQKNDSSLFCFGSSTKKRPFSMVLGRTYDAELLDMYELNVKDFLPMQTFQDEVQPTLGFKPLVICQGAAFTTSEALTKLQNILCDFFSGPKAKKLSLKGIEHIIVLTALDHSVTDGVTGDRGGRAFLQPPTLSDTSSATAAGNTQAPTSSVMFRRFKVHIKKSSDGPKVPRVELAEIGPSFVMQLGRYRLPDSDRWKTAMKIPKMDKPNKTKNVSRSKSATYTLCCCIRA
eukprot:Lankesteria_metandrocarpae@DN3333_c0_g1_i3.p1